MPFTPTKRLFSSLRVRLLLLILAAILPAFGLVVHTALEQRATSFASVQDHAREIALKTAEEEANLIADLRQLLMTLVRMPTFRSGKDDEFRKLGAELIRENPRILNIARVTPDGDIVASVLPLGRPLNVVDRSYFRNAVRSGDLGIGDYQIGWVTGKSTLNFAYPIREPDGRILGVLYVALDLDWLNRVQAARSGHVPDGATLTRVDRNGVVFAHYPDSPGWRGARFPVPKVLDALHRQDNGTVEIVTADGVPRFYFFSRIQRPPGTGNAFAILGIPQQMIFEEGERLLRIRLAGLGAMMMLGFIAAWFGAEATVLRPLRSLLDAARRFGDGDLSARSGLPPSDGEIGTLAAGFDRMAESTESREHALREAQQLYQTLVSTSPDAVTVTDRDGIITFVSRMALTMYGHDTRENVIGENLFEWVAPEDRPMAAESFADLMSGNSLTEKEYRLLRKDGSRFIGEIHASPLFDDSGKPVGLIIATRDVTERIRTAGALRESELRLRAAIDNLPFDFWACDADGRYLLLNTAALEKWPWSDTMIGKKPEELEIAEEIRTIWTENNRRALAGETFQREVRFSLGGEPARDRLDILSPILDGDDLRGLVGVSIDITERKQADSNREELETQLRQSQKMEAVGQLAGGIAHDFNNLMTVVLGQLDLIRRHWKDPLLADRLDEIGKASERAATLTRQLLAFSRRQILQPRVIDLNDVLDEIRAILDRLIGDDYALDIRPGTRLRPVLADPTQIGQVVVNLVVNARDALPDGGTIRITTENVSVQEDDPEQPLSVPAGEYVRLSVQDGGTGMDETAKAHLFEPFFTTKEVGKGTGLGLSTVYGIVMQSGGQIRVESEPSIGTTVHIWLPWAQGETVLPLHVEIPVEPPHGDATLLLVEDAAHVRSLVREILEEYGYVVLEAGSGSEALSVAAAYEGPIDLLLSDMMMPGMNGRKLAEELLPARPGIKVLFMSGYAEEPALRAGNEFAFLQKPFTPEALGWKVHEVLTR